MRPARKRRQLLAAMAGIAVVPFALTRDARAAIESLAPEIEKLIGGRALNPGRIALDIPRLADNGHSVPLRVSVESPMSATDHVRSIALLSERNPRPLVAKFHLGPHAGKAVVATRVRLNGTQRLLVIAELADDSCWYASAEVVVTESACLDET